MHAERRWVPLRRVGVYVPGGLAFYPSAVMMHAIPARVAGVAEVVAVAPRRRGAGLVARRGPHRGSGPDLPRRRGAGDCRARIRDGDDPSRRQDRRPGQCLPAAAKRLVSVGSESTWSPGRARSSSSLTPPPPPTSSRPTCSPRPSTGPDSEAILLSLDRELADAVARARRRDRQRRRSRDVASLDEALALSEAYAPEHLELWVADPEAAARADPKRRHGLRRARPPSSATTPPARRTSCRPEAWRAASGGLGLETFLKPVQIVRATADGSRVRARSALPLARARRAAACTRPRWSWR